MRYVSFIHRDEAGFGVSFPDFPGCVSVGATIDDAVRQGSEALAFHVEGLVDRRGGDSHRHARIDAIKADPELADWRRDADLVLIPLLSGPWFLAAGQHLSRPRPARSDRRRSEAATDDALGISWQRRPGARSVLPRAADTGDIRAQNKMFGRRFR